MSADRTRRRRSLGRRSLGRRSLGRSTSGRSTVVRHGSNALRLLIGLWLYGATMAFMVESELGLDPWDVFHQGVASHVPISFGQVVIITGVVVLLLWIPLRQRPGIGTVANVVVIGIAADVTLAMLPTPDRWDLRALFLVIGIVGNGLAGALYISAGLGAGPRDGLWRGIVARTGRSVRLVRTSLEVAVLAVGFVLGGTVGVGTVLYALAIGPIVQFFLARLERPAAADAAVPAEVSDASR